MEWMWTLAATAGGLVLAAGATLMLRRQPRRLGKVSFVPWHTLMFLGLLAALFGAVHLLTLWARSA